MNNTSSITMFHKVYHEASQRTFLIDKSRVCFALKHNLLCLRFASESSF